MSKRPPARGDVVRPCAYCHRPTRIAKSPTYDATPATARYSHHPRRVYIERDGQRVEVLPLCAITVSNDAAYRDAVLAALGGST